MRRRLRFAFYILIAAFVVAQLVPADRSNPPVESDLTAPAEVKAVLRRACYDCHSHETVWPWYSRIAPVSWLIARDVREGRKDLDFSSWGRLGPDARAKSSKEIWETVQQGEMPPFYYLPLHPEARLSPADRDLLRAWTSGAAANAAASAASSRSGGSGVVTATLSTMKTGP